MGDGCCPEKPSQGPASFHMEVVDLTFHIEVILEPQKIKSDTVSTVSLSISHEVMALDAMIFLFCQPPYSLEEQGGLITLVHLYSEE